MVRCNYRRGECIRLSETEKSKEMEESRQTYVEKHLCCRDSRRIHPGACDAIQEGGNDIQLTGEISAEDEEVLD